jgi:hypothetical protein
MVALPSPSPTDCTVAPVNANIYGCGTYYVETGDYEFTWDLLYFGSCLTEAANNPGNDPGAPAITNEIASGTTADMLASSCSYLNACMNWAIPQAYDNVDFHLIQDSPSQAHWQCVAYYDNAGGNYFNVPNPNVILAYGYDVE